MARTWQQAFPGLSDAHLKETVDSFYNELQTVMGTSGLPACAAFARHQASCSTSGVVQ